jgi:hypothetical protein
MSVAAASAQPLPNAIPNPSWGPAGTVSAVARQGDTLYVGGRFRYVGPGTGPLAVFAIDGAEPTLVAQDFEGSVHQLLPMPDGGWIVAGDIRLSPSAFRRVARIDPQGRFDPSWFVDVAGTVTALATDGSRVFLAGSFFSVNATARTSLAAVDAATGAVLPWNPVLEGTGSPMVSSLAVQQSRLYLAGQFTSVNDVERVGFAALDTASAALLPHAQTAFTAIDDLALFGDTLYLAGRLPTFSYSGIALSASTGQLLPWAMPTTFSSPRIAARSREGASRGWKGAASSTWRSFRPQAQIPRRRCALESSVRRRPWGGNLRRAPRQHRMWWKQEPRRARATWGVSR